MPGAKVEMGGGVSDSLHWIPVYIDRLMTSQRWRLMEDFERGWYWSLIMESVFSPRPGYLRLDSDLWRLAGARSAQFFKAKNAGVLACFKLREIEGEQWIYSERLVRTLEEQTEKYYRKKPPRDSASISVSDLDLDSKQTKGEMCPKISESVEIRNQLERNDAIARAKARGFAVREDGSCYRERVG